MIALPIEDLVVVAGNTLAVDLSLYDLDDNPLPSSILVGATAQMQIRSRMFDDATLVDITGVIDSTNATIHFSVLPAKTLTLLPDKKLTEVHVYGCKVTFADASELTVVTGKLKMMKGVVR